MLYRVKPAERYGEEITPWTSDHPDGLDREFESYCLSCNIEVRADTHYEGWGDVPILYWRPKDLAAAEAWVRDRDVNIDTFAEAFEMMRSDPEIHFYSSW